MLRLVWIFIAASISLYAEQLVVIAHPKSPIDTLTKSQVRMIYLKKSRFWGDIKLVALNLPPTSSLRKTFENEVLNMSNSQIDSYWIREHYKGHRPHNRVESVESMLLFVKKVEGAIGYIPVSKIDTGVKVIYEEGEL
jgi:ABC-type phosphate transport system substrate-binding protein